MRRVPLAAVLVCLLSPSAARPAGGHDDVGCAGCHEQPGADLASSAFCLGCHASAARGGQDILPISAHASHPYGSDRIDPRAARVPPELLRGGRLECVSCHDPHPTNANFAYLRVKALAHDQDGFCVLCHPAKSDRRLGALGADGPG